VNGYDLDTRTGLMAAVASAGVIIGHQVAGKATRDALFLSSYDVTALPAMVMAASVVSLLAVLAASRGMRAVGPGRLLPIAFALSGLLFLAEWALVEPFRKATAVGVYLHLGAVGALFISGFWTLVSERFDPRTAKRVIGRIGAGATAGGVLGGLLAERMAAVSSLVTMLPVLAGLHLLAAGLVLGIRDPDAASRPRGRAGGRDAADGAAGIAGVHGPTKVDHADDADDADDADHADDDDDADHVDDAAGRSPLRVLAEVPYLRHLVALVLLTTVAEGLLDYVFKAEAASAFGEGEALLRLFALFYAGVSLLTFLVQTLATRTTLEKLGLPTTVALYPGAVLAGGLGALAFPGLAGAATARSVESVGVNSLYRSGYEILFAPIPREQKRATKPFIDVGAVRLGDVLSAALIQILLVVGVAGVNSFLLVLVVVLSAAALAVTAALQRGYRRALERSLHEQAVELELNDVYDGTTRFAVMHTVGAMRQRTLGAMRSRISDRRPLATDAHQEVACEEVTERPASARGPDASIGLPADPLLRRIAALRSADPRRVRAALFAEPPPGPALVAHIVPLLAWDEVAPEAVAVLHVAGPRAPGQLLDALLDPEQEFTVRRRLPTVLARIPEQRVVDGLLEALGDDRFEVRYRCGLALNRLRRLDGELVFARERVLGAVIRELDVDRRIGRSRRLLDRLEDADTAGSPVDDYLRSRANRSLEHVFDILALCFPAMPLRIAFRGLQSENAMLRGTALEYLEATLPGDVVEKLLRFLEGDGGGDSADSDEEAVRKDSEGTLVR